MSEIIDVPNIRVRPMTSQDVDEFADWEQKERPYPWKAPQFLECLSVPSQHALVWQSEKGILAFAVYQTILSEAYLLNIMVHPEHREKGVGVRVLQDTEKMAKDRGATVLVLDVDENNIGAQALYNKEGFRVVQRRPHAYPLGENALTMRKQL